MLQCYLEPRAIFHCSSMLPTQPQHNESARIQGGSRVVGCGWRWETHRAANNQRRMSYTLTHAKAGTRSQLTSVLQLLLTFSKLLKDRAARGPEPVVEIMA